LVSASEKELIAYLDAIDKSGSRWEIVIAEGASREFIKVLKRQEDKKFSASDVVFILPEGGKGNEKVVKQIQRVFGEGAKIK
jgi:hypothetical protein